MKIILAICVLGAMSGSALAHCNAPLYRKGSVWEDSDTNALLAISIRFADFAPQRLVCLAVALKQKYSGRNKINVLIFSSHEAARHYLPKSAGDLDEPAKRHGKSYDPYSFYAKQMHAYYSYDAQKQEEYLEVKPEGYDHEEPYDTRIDLPVATPPICKLSVGGRCLVAFERIPYPESAKKAGISGRVTLTGSIARNGAMTNVRVQENDSSPNEGQNPLADAALASLKSWRFDAGASQQDLRIAYVYILVKSLPDLALASFEMELPNRVAITTVEDGQR